MDQFDRYLKVPMNIGRNQRAAFEPLKPKAWKKINGWKPTCFSKGGKEVILKAVTKAVPTYYLSVFKLPESIVNWTL